MIIVLLILGLTDSNVDIVFAWFLSGLIYESVDIASGATEDFVRLGHVPSVAWEVFFFVLDECLGSHF